MPKNLKAIHGVHLNVVWYKTFYINKTEIKTWHLSWLLWQTLKTGYLRNGPWTLSGEEMTSVDLTPENKQVSYTIT